MPEPTKETLELLGLINELRKDLQKAHKRIEQIEADNKKYLDMYLNIISNLCQAWNKDRKPGP